jgi:acyl dehydratase
VADFDPTAHRLVPTRTFDELTIGEQFPIPSRTVTDGQFAAFQVVSADNHPVHYDAEYCRSQGHSAPIAHGFQVLSATAPGAGLFPHVMGQRLMGFLEQSSRFLAPVYLGDTLYPELTITDLVRQRTTGVVTLRATVHNQHRTLVLDGTQKFLIRL